MIYVEVNFSVAPKDRTAAVDCLTKEAPVMQGLPGNRGCRVLVDPVADDAVTLLHQWDDLASLDAYRTGPLFAQVGGVLRPMMTGAPSTVVYEASAIG
ncbi:antibiotic biosynthesis monooxygenase [Yoonia sp. F2084L]|uniref:putative quinol monooxygenase n=1 Tax=Yoonia sp. F2084L TaxID=2926419 RepID=UPI001FF548F2|nr:antibiotic biosynthesis monooxygenase family protein [Yoonia sp. F2084L]MCK0095451.1 antibiotic biosynthesis monooxygenase [Yoonia sp. F2084L]